MAITETENKLADIRKPYVNLPLGEMFTEKAKQLKKEVEAKAEPVEAELRNLYANLAALKLAKIGK